MPLRLLNQLPDAPLTWLVPGMVREKVTHYLKALPKALAQSRDSDSRSRDGLPRVAAAVGRRAARRAARFLDKRLSDTLPASILRDVELPPHLAVNVTVVDDAGAELASGRDLAALRAQLGEAAQLSFAATDPAFERKGLRAVGLRRPAADAHAHARRRRA